VLPPIRRREHRTLRGLRPGPRETRRAVAWGRWGVGVHGASPLVAVVVPQEVKAGLEIVAAGNGRS